MTSELSLKDYPLTMPGSKRRIIASIAPHIPEPASDGRLIVPFFGTGVDSFYMHKRGAKILAFDGLEILARMHNTFESCVARAQAWLDAREAGESIADRYAALRDRYNAMPEPWIFYLLTRLSYRSLVRHNSKGKFNAPPDNKPASLCTPQRATEHAQFIAAIGGVTALPFEDSFSYVRWGDVVYADPIYLGTFDGYTGRGFNHELFFDWLSYLTSFGIAWACSNSPAASDALRSAGANAIIELERAGTVNSDTSKRGKVKEILAVYTPEQKQA